MTLPSDTPIYRPAAWPADPTAISEHLSCTCSQNGAGVPVLEIVIPANKSGSRRAHSIFLTDNGEGMPKESLVDFLNSHETLGPNNPRTS